MNITINRKIPFDPEKFIGKGWSIESEDKESLKLKKINLDDIVFHTGLKDGESYITGEEKLKRMTGIQFDAKILQTLYENPKYLEYIYEKTGKAWFEFMGTILRRPLGHRYALCACREDDGSWSWFYNWLDDVRPSDDPAVGFASPQNSDTKPLDPLNLALCHLAAAEEIIKKARELLGRVK
jgi:hypothetical protein